MTDGTLYLVTGASRSGKSTWLLSRLARDYESALAWDPTGQYAQQPGWEYLATRRDLQAFVTNPDGRRGCYVTECSVAAFDVWSLAAHAYIRIVKGRAAVIAEEISDVTNPGKAPPQYGVLIRRGLRYGKDLYAVTQHPAESDKTTVRNAGVIHVHGLNGEGDADYMARRMSVDLGELLAIRRDRHEWIEKDMRTGVLTRSTDKNRAKSGKKRG